MTPEWYVIVLLCCVAAAAGWVDAVSGGGGLLLILAALVLVWIFVALRPQLGLVAREVSAARRWTTAIVGGVVIGLYDGLLGPGTGAFLVILLVAATGFTFLQASATAKIVNIGTNLAALLIFGWAGAVAWGLGIMMGACNVLGAVVGARTAIARGSGFVRGVLLIVVAALIVALAWQTLGD